MIIAIVDIHTQITVLLHSQVNMLALKQQVDNTEPMKS